MCPNNADLNELVIRDVIDEDIYAIQRIYADHVSNGLASWEEIPPDENELRHRRDFILSQDYPYRVALFKNCLVGYSYASAYRPRPAYRNTVENSIYVAESAARRGFGLLLLRDLITQCTERGFRLMVAVIGDSKNTASIKLHERAGFVMGGIIPACGYKKDQWLDQVIMHRPLGTGAETQPTIEVKDVYT